MKKPLLFTTLFFAILIAYFWVNNDVKSQNKNPRAAREVTVITGKVTNESLSQSLTIIGKLNASKNVQIAPQISGKVIAIYFDDNQKVEQGQILVQFDDAKERANVAETKAKLTDEQRKLNEFNKLVDSNAISQTQIDAQQALVEMAKARLSAAKAELSHYVLSAPFTGFTGLKNFSEGQMVAVGNELVSLDDLSLMYLDLSVPEQYLSHLTLGMPITATSQAWSDQDFSGNLIAISPRVNANTLTLTARIAFDNPKLKLRPGMMMSTKVNLPALSKPTIPVQALEYSGTKRFVYLVDENHIAHRTEVHLGARVEDKVFIEKGIKLDDEIIIQGLVNMRDGLKIKRLDNKQIALEKSAINVNTGVSY